MRRTLTSVTAVAAFLLPGLAAATIIVPRTLEEMARESAAVVRAKVVQRQSAWDDDHRRIHTFAELQVLETVHGGGLGDTLVVRTMGGEVGDIGMRVSGTASFTVGEEVLVFLRADPVDATRFQVIGMSQGKYTIDRAGPTPMAVASTAGLAFARRTASGTLAVEGHANDDRALPLATLLTRVKSALQTPQPTAPKTPAIPAAPTPAAPTPSTTVAPD